MSRVAVIPAPELTPDVPDDEHRLIVRRFQKRLLKDGRVNLDFLDNISEAHPGVHPVNGLFDEELQRLCNL